MKRCSIVVLMMGLVGLALLSCSEKSNEPSHNFDVYPVAGSFQWHDLSVIRDSNPAKKSFSMLVICANWCHYCSNLRNITLKDSTVMGLIDTYYNACIIDGDCDSLVDYADTVVSCHDLAKDILKIPGFPTMIFYDRAGVEIDRVAGYYEPKSFAKRLWRVCMEGE